MWSNSLTCHASSGPSVDRFPQEPHAQRLHGVAGVDGERHPMLLASWAWRVKLAAVLDVVIMRNALWHLDRRRGVSASSRRPPKAAGRQTQQAEGPPEPARHSAPGSYRCRRGSLVGSRCISA
jgi:hypothetical protein